MYLYIQYVSACMYVCIQCMSVCVKCMHIYSVCVCMCVCVCVCVYLHTPHASITAEHLRSQAFNRDSRKAKTVIHYPTGMKNEIRLRTAHSMQLNYALSLGKVSAWLHYAQCCCLGATDAILTVCCDITHHTPIVHILICMYYTYTYTHTHTVTTIAYTFTAQCMASFDFGNPYTNMDRRTQAKSHVSYVYWRTQTYLLLHKHTHTICTHARARARTHTHTHTNITGRQAGRPPSLTCQPNGTAAKSSSRPERLSSLTPRNVSFLLKHVGRLDVRPLWSPTVGVERVEHVADDIDKTTFAHTRAQTQLLSSSKRAQGVTGENVRGHSVPFSVLGYSGHQET